MTKLFTLISKNIFKNSRSKLIYLTQTKCLEYRPWCVLAPLNVIFNFCWGCGHQNNFRGSATKLVTSVFPLFGRFRKKRFSWFFFSQKHRRHKNFGICFSHILDFIHKKNYIRKISNDRVIHVLRQRLDTIGVKLRKL